ncbi:PREDICTED: uncharacterized protein LOC101292924 isoform 1 [Fragaria vesca subsp. vesca]
MTFVICSYFQVFKLGLYVFFIQCKPIKDNKDDNEVVRRVVKEMCKMCKAIEENDEVVCRGINSVSTFIITFLAAIVKRFRDMPCIALKLYSPTLFSVLPRRNFPFFPFCSVLSAKIKG